jgi:hypothetical protein
MTLREVEAVLGKGHQMGKSSQGFSARVWVRLRGCAWVTFDRSGGLFHAEFYDADDPALQAFVDLFGIPPEPSWFERLRALRPVLPCW